ncbi:MAG: cytochrome P460 family protein [Hyphomicrobiales bacterium]|nr:cytochrome P460 family protein [Hyphomicrobiales bacterium]
MNILKSSAACFAILAMSTTAHAACTSDTPGPEMSFDQAQTVYECLKEELQANYAKGDKGWIPSEFVTDYPNWRQVSTKPAAPGFHGGRFLVTYVNETGADAYIQYGEAPIPAGTIITKESFAVDDQGAVSAGPLFIMEKTETGKSPETDDWYYMMVAPNGSPQAVNVMTACNECHQGNFGEQQNLGFPVEEVRLKP